MEASSINTLKNQKKIVNLFIRLVKKIIEFSCFFCLSGGYSPLIYSYNSRRVSQIKYDFLKTVPKNAGNDISEILLMVYFKHFSPILKNNINRSKTEFRTEKMENFDVPQFFSNFFLCS